MGHPDIQLVLSLKGVLGLRDSEELVRVRLSSRSLDPLAVRLSVDSQNGTTSWVFARDLLTRGLHGCIGEGVVQVRPCPHPSRRALLELVLEGDAGFARLLLPRGLVSHFLDSSAAFTHGEISHELLVADLATELAEILSPEGGQDQFDQ